MTGRLVGVGVGPGDPDLLTLRALRVLGEADLVFVPDGGRAEAVVADHVPPDRIAPLSFAMRDGAARGARWDAAGEEVAAVLRAGQTAAFCTLGDPSLYSTFTYVAQTVARLVPDGVIERVPGITAMQELAARTGTVLAEGDEPLTLLPVVAGREAQLAGALAGEGTVVAYKGGGRHGALLGALREAGRLEGAVYGADLGTGREVVRAAADLDGSRAPYMSTVLAPPARGHERGGRL